MKRRNKKWIQKAVEHPGRVREYLKRIYGGKAFTKNGDLRLVYIRKAIEDLKRRPPSKRPPGLLNALYLAVRLKRMSRKG